MKALIASIAAVASVAALSTAASAGGHHSHHGHGYGYGFVRYAPVYVQPEYTCKWVWHHGYAHKTCFKVYDHH